jgi:hypothetical protein
MLYSNNHKMIKLIIFGIVLAAIIWFAAKRYGENFLLKDYEQEYKTLDRMVHKYHVGPQNYTRIKHKFTIIKKYSCKDEERLDVLSREFKSKYKLFVDKENQTKTKKR